MVEKKDCFLKVFAVTEKSNFLKACRLFLGESSMTEIFH